MTSSLAFGPALVVMIAATFVLAGMVKGVTGMGLPTVAMGILGSLISPVAAAAMLLLPSLIAFADKQFVPVWRRWKYTPITQTTVANAADSSGGDTACQRLDYRW